MEHYQKLENMYRSAAVHQHFPEYSFHLEDGFCQIKTSVSPSYHHAAGGMHGFYYFMLLDDSGYFAAACKEAEHFLLTGRVDTQLRRPVAEGELIAEGRFIRQEGKIYYCESELYHNGKLAAKASLELYKGPTLLESVKSYSLERS